MLHRGLGFVIICFLLGCQEGSKEIHLAGEALGTTYSVKVFHDEELPYYEALDSIFERVNQSMSTYRSDSDISRINRGDSLIRVDSLFREVLRLSRQVFLQSNGYFDPTVGNLVNQYGFGPRGDVTPPDARVVDSLMRYVGLEKVSLDTSGKVKFEISGMYLDFNAIAKGYAVDLIGRYLDQHDVRHYLVEVGGELLAKGENLDKGSPWIVGIDSPDQSGSQRTLTAAVRLTDRAMATSGNYRKNRFDPETGETYVHTINPLTGHAERSDLLSATVLAENCALADAYATAFMAMGYEKSRTLLDRLEGIDAFLIYSSSEEKIRQYMTAGFKEIYLEL